MPNNLAAFNSQAWSKRLVERLNQVNVMLGLVNRNWEGDLRNNKSVQVRTAGNIAFTSYSKGGNVNYQDITPIVETFTVADAQLAAFNVDDIDKAQSDISAMDVYLGRTVVAMNNLIERKLLATYSSAAVTIGSNAGSGAVLTPVLGTGTLANAVVSLTITTAGTGYTGTPIVQIVGGDGYGATATATQSAGAINAVTVVAGGTNYTIAPQAIVTGSAGIQLDSGTGATGIYTVLTQAAGVLTKQNVPNAAGSRWAVLDVDSVNLIRNDTAHFTKATDLGDRVVQTALFDGAANDRSASGSPGFVGQCAGMSVYEINHVPTAAGNKFLLCGNNEAISYASQIVLMEMLRLQSTVADAARCLLLHDTFVSAENAKRLVVIAAKAS